jgi:hypothetical protein
MPRVEQTPAYLGKEAWARDHVALGHKVCRRIVVAERWTDLPRPSSVNELTGTGWGSCRSGTSYSNRGAEQRPVARVDVVAHYL